MLPLINNEGFGFVGSHGNWITVCIHICSTRSVKDHRDCKPTGIEEAKEAKSDDYKLLGSDD